MGDELISQNTAILFDLNKVDGDCRDFGLNNSAEGVREGDIDVGQVEIYVVIVRLFSTSA